MKTLVSGAHGFIGSYLCEELLAQGFQVRALLSPWGKTDHLAAVLDHPELEIIRADISKPESLKGVCHDIELVFHAAAKVADWGPAQAFYRTNVLGTQYLLDEALKSQVKRFVLVSSLAVHRYSGFRHADPRNTPRNGDINAYARSKVMAEDIVLAAKGLEPVIIRPGLWPFGPRDPNFARAVTALKKGFLPLVNGGRAVINTAFIGNLVQGLILAGTVENIAGKSYLIADEGMVSWRELFQTLADLLGVSAPRFSVPGFLIRPAGIFIETGFSVLAPEKAPPLSRYGGQLMCQDAHFSLQHAQAELGYKPLWSWQEGLRLSLEQAALSAG